MWLCMSVCCVSFPFLSTVSFCCPGIHLVQYTTPLVQCSSLSFFFFFSFFMTHTSIITHLRMFLASYLPLFRQEILMIVFLNSTRRFPNASCSTNCNCDCTHNRTHRPISKYTLHLQAHTKSLADGKQVGVFKPPPSSGSSPGPSSDHNSAPHISCPAPPPHVRHSPSSLYSPPLP